MGFVDSSSFWHLETHMFLKNQGPLSTNFVVLTKNQDISDLTFVINLRNLRLPTQSNRFFVIHFFLSCTITPVTCGGLDISNFSFVS